jgi:uncharacterized delta-60 repeat protein
MKNGSGAHAADRIAPVNPGVKERMDYIRRLAARGLISVIACCALAFDARPAQAHPGDADPSFSTDGIATVDVGRDPAIARDVDVADDGRITAAGYVAWKDEPDDGLVARFMPDGSPDTSFGSGGMVVSDFGLPDAFIQSLALTPDGRTLLAGRSDHPFVARLNSDGSPDPSFAGSGTIGLQQWGVRGVADIARTPDDGVIVAANTLSGGVILKFDAAGGLFTQFAGDGSREFPDRPWFRAHSVAIDANGRIVVGGSDESIDDGGDDLVVTRLVESGDTDPTFRNGTFQRVPCLPTGSCNGLFNLDISPTGVIAYGGTIGVTPGNVDPYTVPHLAVLDGAGEFAPGFGTESENRLPLREVNDVEIDQAGVMAADSAWIDTETKARDYAAAVRRILLDTAGADPAFGRAGRAVLSLTDRVDRFRTLTTQQNGRIIAAGVAGDDLAVTRLRMDDSPPNADGDSLLNHQDRCRFRFATTESGCPTAPQSIELQKRRLTLPGKPEQRYLVATLRSPNPTCLNHRVRPGLFRERAGADPLIARGRATGPEAALRRRYYFEERPEPGSLYARIQEIREPTLGICLGARSRSISG